MPTHLEQAPGERRRPSPASLGGIWASDYRHRTDDSPERTRPSSGTTVVAGRRLWIC